MGVGELPADVLQVDVLVHKSHLNESKKIISDYKDNYSPDIIKEEWKCSLCENMNPPSFEICWNCKE